MTTSTDSSILEYEQNQSHRFLDELGNDQGSSSSLLSASSFSPAAVASNTCSTGGIKINALFISPTNDNDEKEFRQSNIVQKHRQSTPHSSPSSIACSESRLGPKLKASSKRKTVELLSDDQKRANHIASEQKRRANIRIGFEQLVATVPTLSHGHKSEALILQKSVEHLRGLVESKLALKERARKLQLMLGEIPDEDSSEGELDYDF